MTDSPAEPSTAGRLPVRVLAVLVLAAVSFAASAQAPTPEGPRRPLILAPLPRATGPATVQPEQAPPTAPGAIDGSGLQPPPGDAVQAAPLATIGADSVGTLTAAEGGFGEDMWQGTPRPLIERLLPYLPVTTDSAAMQGLARRLLLSTAAAPPAEGAEAGSLIALRVELLMRMGALEAVESLLAATPSRSDYGDLARIEADARFMANDNARACALAAARIRDAGEDYWQKALTFCQMLAGQQAQAALGVSLLRETGVEDPTFFALMDALGGGARSPRTLERMAAPTPLTLAMARAANVQLPAEVASASQPGVLRVVATSPNAPVELRLDAAERAEAAGALPTDTLRQIYMAVNFSEEALANPLSRAEAESGPVSRALLYRTAMVETIPTAQAESVGRAFALARKGGRYASAARTFAPVLKRIPPSAELLWFAPEAVRAFLMAGEADMAKSWFGVLRASALFNPESAAAVAALRPVFRLAGSTEVADWKPADLGTWWQRAKATEEGRRQAALVFSLFDAFGEPLPEGAWATLLDTPERVTTPVVQPPLWFRLRDAAAAGRVGETVLLSLLTLGAGGPTAVDALTLHDVVARLRGVQLEPDARALAVEAVLAAGV